MKPLQDEFPQTSPLNLTPVIDIVFLLEIFFMLVCQFITAENFEVTVPDEITTSRDLDINDARQSTTVTVMQVEDNTIRYAVGSEILPDVAIDQYPDRIAEKIDRQLSQLPPQRRLVTLRIDRDMRFEFVKHALLGIAQSSATDIHWAVMRQPTPM
jgi:biopolymer transport protein ExbD